MAKKKVAKKKKTAKKKAKPENPLQEALADIEKAHGEGAIMRLGDNVTANIEAISTGALSLDLALGIGGVPRGRVIEVFGPESSGKTTLALSIIANAQKSGGVAAFIDAEHALDPVYARNLGVDLDGLLVSQPDTGEQALEIAERLVRSNSIDVIAIDSVAALVPKAEIEGEMGELKVGLQARLMSQALRKLAGIMYKSRTCVIFINQIRMKIGVMWGSPETTPGGRALKFYSSVRVDIRRIGALKDGDTHIGNATRAKIVKNKVASPFRVAEFDIIFGKGISYEGSLIDAGIEQGIIKQAGSWFSYGDTKLGQGKEQVRQLLIDDKELANELDAKVRAAVEGFDIEEVEEDTEIDSSTEATTEAPGEAPKKE